MPLTQSSSSLTHGFVVLQVGQRSLIQTPAVALPLSMGLPCTHARSQLQSKSQVPVASMFPPPVPNFKQ
eukprot:scaffold375_cov157-Amphora_coffeaeformis.AAC.9